MRRFGPSAGLQPQRVVQTPRPIEDYAGRSGYDPSFVDAAQPLPLPGTGAWKPAGVDSAALPDGDDPHELKYTHFSVKVSSRRRLPLFSAVNIDGAKSDRTVKRTKVWRFDPRIGRERHALIMSGAAILQTLMRIWPTSKLSVADRGLREGLLYSQMVRDGVLAAEGLNGVA